MARVINGQVDNAPKKLIGEIFTSGMVGPKGDKGDKGDPGPQGPMGPPGGVNSFNSRQGEVIPQIGDYDMAMVGAEYLTNTEIDEIWNL